MRLSEFWMRMDRRFGVGYSESVARDQVLPSLNSRTAEQALREGASVKDVWRAVEGDLDATASHRVSG